MGKGLIPGIAIPCVLAIAFSVPTDGNTPQARTSPFQQPNRKITTTTRIVNTPGSLRPKYNEPLSLMTPSPTSTPVAEKTETAVTRVDSVATHSISPPHPDEFVSRMAPPSDAKEHPGTAVTLAPAPYASTTPFVNSTPAPLDIGPRDSGWTARTFARYQTGNEGYFFKPTEYSAFDLKGMEYGVGLRRDVSVDTIIGGSFTALDYRITGTGYADNRKNDVSGWLVSVDASTAFRLPMFGNRPFLLEGSLGAGILETEGSGAYMNMPWREQKHDSSLYRASAMIRTNEQTKYSFHLESEFGIEMTRVSSDAYAAEWESGDYVFYAAKKSSTSLAVPIRFTLWDEYPFRWGTGVLRLMLGARYEFGNGGTAAYSFNSSAGGMASPDMSTGRLNLAYDPRGCEWEMGAGIDMWAYRGWYCRADYKARFSGSLNQINENLFSLELGACF